MPSIQDFDANFGSESMANPKAPNDRVMPEMHHINDTVKYIRCGNAPGWMDNCRNSC